MKLPFPFKPTQEQPQSTWPWPSCGSSTKTLSFRAAAAATTTTDMFKTINSAYEEMGISTTTTTSTHMTESQLANDSEDDSVIQGVMRGSERLFFTPGETSSILEEAKTKQTNTNNGFSVIKEKSVVMEEIESTNPYVDFKKSMEEMVEANEGLKESMEGLQGLLSCYLRVNGKSNHGYIIGAFVDLLVSLSFANHNHDSSSSSNSPVSALSFSSNSSSCTTSTNRSTTPCSIEEGDETSTSASDKTLVVVLDNASSSSSSSQV